MTSQPRRITEDEFSEALASVERTAFRLELQPAYSIPKEADLLAELAAGHEVSPEDVPALRPWFDQIRRQTSEGRRIERVRVVDEPLTDYQRWAQYCDPWNTKAGERIRYLSRGLAHEVGLLPDAGPDDWWLLDGHTLLIMHFDPDGKWLGTELTMERSAVERAAAQRDLAIHHSHPSTVRSTAA